MEEKAIKGNYSRLIEGIKHELPTLVTALYQADLIGDDTKDAALSSLVTERAKATKVVDALQSRIRNNPSDFFVLVEVLRANPALSYLADILENHDQQPLAPAKAGILRSC